MKLLPALPNRSTLFPARIFPLHVCNYSMKNQKKLLVLCSKYLLWLMVCCCCFNSNTSISNTRQLRTSLQAMVSVLGIHTQSIFTTINCYPKNGHPIALQLFSPMQAKAHASLLSTHFCTTLNCTARL